MDIHVGLTRRIVALEKLYSSCSSDFEALRQENNQLRARLNALGNTADVLFGNGSYAVKPWVWLGTKCPQCSSELIRDASRREGCISCSYLQEAQHGV